MSKELGITQSALARAVGTTASVANGWFGGITTPNAEQVYAIGRLLGCGVDRLFGDVAGNLGDLRRAHQLLKPIVTSIEQLLPIEVSEEMEKAWIKYRDQRAKRTIARGKARDPTRAKAKKTAKKRSKKRK